MMSVVIAASGMRFPDTVEDAEEALRPVAAAHGAQDAVGTRLERHVELRHHRGRLRHRVDHIVGERGGVRTGEAQPLEPRNRTNGAQQLAEREPVAELDPVGVDVLPQERDLDDSVVDERLDLGQDVGGPPVLLLATERGHDAERAGVVAAHRD